MEKEDEDEEEDQDEDDGKDPRKISQGETVHTSADIVDTMVDDQPVVLAAQGQEMRGHTPRPQPSVSFRRPQTMEPHVLPRTPETYPLSGLEHLGRVMPQKTRPVVSTLREADAAGNTSDMDVDIDLDVDQQLLIESAGGDSLPDVPIRKLALPDVPLPEVPVPDVPRSEACPDCLVGEELTSSWVAEEAMVVAFSIGSCSCLVRFLCSNLFITGISYTTHHKVFGWLKVYFIYGLLSLVLVYS